MLAASLAVAHVAATKPNMGNASRIVGRNRIEQMDNRQDSGSDTESLSNVPLITPIVTDLLGVMIPTNSVYESDLCFWLMETQVESVQMGLAWTDIVQLTNSLVEIYVCPDLSPGHWRKLANVNLTGVSSNAVIALSRELLSSNGVDTAAFFSISTGDDSDGDGISDAYEQLVLKTNPELSDTDGDGIDDGEELQLGLNPCSADSDADGLSDGLERVAGTDPWMCDTDGDGLLDSTEVLYLHSNPLAEDSDGDGVSDGQEFAIGANLCAVDTDGDGVPDSAEVEQGSSPVDPLSSSARPRAEAHVEQVSDTAEDYVVTGDYNVHVTYSGDTSGDFNVLGIAPPGGYATCANIDYDIDGPISRNAFELTASGATFTPAKTGWYEFQLQVDDEAELHVGELTATAQWGVINPGNSVSNVFIAGRSYPISVTANSVGGPARLQFPKFGEFTPVARPEVSAALSRETVFFETSFQEHPRYRINPPTPPVVYTLTVNGGHFGGTLQLSGNGLDALALISGSQPPVSYAVGPGERKTWKGTYQGCLPSLQQDDKEICATFVENETAESLVVASRFTAIEVAVRCIYPAPANTSSARHLVGVGEKLRFSVNPDLEGVSLSADSLNDGDMFQYHNTFGNVSLVDADKEHVYVCPASAAQLAPVRVSYRSEVYHPQIVLIEPQEVVCRKVRWDGSCFPSGEVGVGALQTENYIKPDYVSFHGILVGEIPCGEIIPGTGYFLDPPPNVSRSHIGIAGGTWTARQVRLSDNYWTTDSAGGGPYSGWGASRMEWKIPIGWFRRWADDDDHRSGISAAENETKNDSASREWLIRGRNDVYKQVYSIDADGKASVSKHGHTLARTRGCRVTLDKKVLQRIRWSHD